MLGRGEFYDIKKRNSQANNSYGEAWANAGNTPYRLYKHYTHEGGSATPFFVHWPKGITGETKDWYREPAQLIDIMPTLLDVAGTSYPDKREEQNIPALDGISLRPAFSHQSLNREPPIFIEHETNASVRDGQWKLVGTKVSMFKGTNRENWELYDMLSDPTETNNLISKKPEIAERLADQWETWAKRVNVYPRGKISPKSAVSKKKK